MPIGIYLRKYIPPEQLFWAKVNKTDTCWEWMGHKDSLGYGRFTNRHVSWKAHRFAYTAMVGPIPDGLTLDHLCRNRACVNPAHLEPVTLRINILRGIGPCAVHARRSCCMHGHPFDEINTYVYSSGRRSCRTCRRLSWHRWVVKNSSHNQELAKERMRQHRETLRNQALVTGEWPS